MDYAIKQIAHYQIILEQLERKIPQTEDVMLCEKFQITLDEAQSAIDYYQEKFHSEFAAFLIETDQALKTTSFRMC